MACPNFLDKDIAYLIKVKIRDSVTVCRFNQVCRSATVHEIRTLPNGEKHGLWKHFGDGQLKSEGTYRDGAWYGFWKHYWGNEQLEFEGAYQDDKRLGLWKFYHINGQIWCEGTYKDGKQHGLFKWYRENGQLSSEKYYKDGKLEN